MEKAWNGVVIETQLMLKHIQRNDLPTGLLTLITETLCSTSSICYLSLLHGGDTITAAPGKPTALLKATCKQ